MIHIHEEDVCQAHPDAVGEPSARKVADAARKLKYPYFRVLGQVYLTPRSSESLGLGWKPCRLKRYHIIPAQMYPYADINLP